MVQNSHQCRVKNNGGKHGEGKGLQYWPAVLGSENSEDEFGAFANAAGYAADGVVDELKSRLSPWSFKEHQCQDKLQSESSKNDPPWEPTTIAGKSPSNKNHYEKA
jgi:hypothetical protein